MTSTTVQNGVSDGCDNSAKTKYQIHHQLPHQNRPTTNNNGDDFLALNSAGSDMNRKIQVNGETELRIDERNISVHINNPFLSDKPSTSTEPDYAEVNKFRPKRPHSIPVSSALNDLQTPPSSSSSSVVQSLYNQYRNSPQRFSLLQPNDQASSYLPPSPLAQSVNENNNILPQLPQLPPKNLSLQQPVVPRRSQSTPRPNHPPISGTNRDGSPSTIIVNGQIVSQRPRSLDRCASVEKTNGTYNPPPIPLRRLSQPGGIPLNNSNSSTTTPTGFNSIRNKNNIVVTPTTSVISVQQQPISRGNIPGSNVSTNSGGAPTSSMRHSITFHGPLNRQSSIGGAGHQLQQKTPTMDNGNVIADHTSAGTLPGKRNDKRPTSYAYGSVPDQAYLENQLRIYSEQLRSITESVRKYSEQAKLLSELKRQQNQQSPIGVVHKPIPMSQSAGNFQASILSPDPRTSSSSSLHTDAQTPSHQLRMFLENIRSSMRTPDTPVGTVLPPSTPQPTPEEDHKPVKVPFKPISPAPLTTSNEPKAKTPSDQLRMFLDAIRSNQEPEPLAKSPNLLMTSSKELTLTKQRPKSTSNENFGHSMSTSESFHQISDNLRIMSQDLQALSPSRNAVASKTQPLNIQTDQTSDFYQILDNFHKMADHYKAIGSIEYLKKCSEALMQSTEFLKQQQRLQLQNNGFGTDTDSSSCSTTPGSIREAVQNLLMQPRNGFQIMDDRLSLFIDIIDSQEKFSQVGSFFFLTYRTVVTQSGFQFRKFKQSS